MRHARLLYLLPIAIALAACPNPAPPTDGFRFTVAADMRDFTGACEFKGVVRAARRVGAGDFMICPGDIDPPSGVDSVLQEVLGPGFVWYPVVGNHEADTPADMSWLRALNAGGNTLPRIVHSGPAASLETCYSFDEGNVHFAVINEYYDGLVDNNPTGDVSPDLLDWLETDLAANTKPIVFVVGHEPAWPQPDAAPPHRLRHVGESLDAFPVHRDAFWQTLINHGVTAYLCGHTHDFSVIKLNGIWQIDAGHARGYGDTGAPSTFLRITVHATAVVEWEAWRMDLLTGIYSIRNRGTL